MSLQYIIDGCNVTHYPGFIKNIPKKPVDSRVFLIELIRLRNLCANKSLIWLVFDGYPDQGLENLEKGRLRIIFSRKQSADEKIKKILELTDNLKNTVVVSDDKEVASFAKIMRAKAVSVERFLGENRFKHKGFLPEEPKVSYSSMQKINEELKRLWLG
ncbi:MAG: NYN domain-containing protein [Candidatus Omnitrophica bacterium]|nr:NYN domain-containing protein [Candidatus Omnitrophota bacterium]